MTDGYKADTMPTLVITRSMLDADNRYVGSADITAWIGHIEIAADLGTVMFRATLSAAGHISALAGSGIKAGDGIEAGWCIKAGLSIEAESVSARLRIFAGLCSWRMPTPLEMQIRAQLHSGTIAYGTLVPLVDKDETPKSDAAL